jgi:tetratricopeptide (TPR) repeat protein
MDATPLSSTAEAATPSLGGSTPAVATDRKPRRQHGKVVRRIAVVAIVLAGLPAAAYFAYDAYRVIDVSRAARRSFATRQYKIAAKPLARWLALRPRSGEAHYYKAWQAMALNQPEQVVEAINEARKLGFDPALLGCLTAVYQARGERFREAEPVLEQAFWRQFEPRDMVAKELARIYLSSFRFDRAAQVIERWRSLAPDDAQPYVWRNEIASRSESDPAMLILNDRAALERDPNLDKTRLDLAQQLSKARRFDEAAQVYHDYLKRKPNDALALIGLGQDEFQCGDIEGATRFFESALDARPRDRVALKELAMIEMRLGRLEKACERFEVATKIDPFDHEVRSSYAQALKLLGRDNRARVESAEAARLREQNDLMMKYRFNLLEHPNDLDARFQVARWLIESGHPDEGLRWTKEILRSNPSHTPTHRVLANYYRKQGETGLANYHQLMSSSP